MCLYQTKLTTPENTITYHDALCVAPQNFSQVLSSVSLGSQRGTENKAYAKFWRDKQRALWYVMVFSGVVNSLMNATNVFQLFYYPMWIHPLSVICTVKFLFYV